MSPTDGQTPESCVEIEKVIEKERRHIMSGAGRDPNFGIALSGGGIRSATFCLGVLEHLRSLGLLRRAGYLSTVSGGGYIGGWLAAATLRDPTWTDSGKYVDEAWSKSIAHLRRHSNYLSPQLGLMSADTWAMVMVWVRNTLILQILVALLMGAVLTAPRLVGLIPLPESDAPWTFWLAATVIGLGAGWLVRSELKNLSAYLKQDQYGGGQCTSGTASKPRAAAVFLLLLCALLSYVFVRAVATKADKYSSFSSAVNSIMEQGWPLWVFIGTVFALKTVFAWEGMRNTPGTKTRMLVSLLSACAGSACVFVLSVLLVVATAAVAHVQPGAVAGATVRIHWLVWTFGPPALMGAFSIAIIIQIGVLSRALDDMHREWWSRLGAYLGIYAVIWVAVWGLSVFGPLLAWQLGEHISHWATSGGLAALVAIAVRMAQSSRTATGASREETKSPWADRLTVLFATLAILGLIVLAAAGIHIITVHALGTPGGGYWREIGLVPAGWMILFAIGLGSLLLLWSNRADLNQFSLNQFYRHRLVRCYLGATRPNGDSAHVQQFIGFRPNDDLPLTWLTPGIRPNPLSHYYTGPLPLINTALNLGGSSDLEVHSRHAGPFLLSPLYSGSSRSTVGYKRTGDLFRDGEEMKLGAAVSISGAAAHPNMGYHTSPLPAFLMTVFNVRLGWWVPNPNCGKKSRLRFLAPIQCLVAEMFGGANDKSSTLDLSDGGHFENLGIYELLRRRCRLIIACDAEEDCNLSFGSLGALIRFAAADLGTDIEIDVSPIRNRDANGMSKTHCAIGTIRYPEKDGTRAEGTLVYLKSSLTGDEPTDVVQYRAENAAFPHESTGDQFFSESQFGSYQHLGRHVAYQALAPLQRLKSLKDTSLIGIALTLRQAWTPRLGSENFSKHAAALTDLWREMRKDPDLHYLDEQFFPEWPHLIKDMDYAQLNTWWSPSAAGNWVPRSADAFRKGFYLCSEIIQLMESVYVDLNLEQNHSHPDTRGWMSLFRHWSWSGLVRIAWSVTKPTYGARFQTFCESRLGMDNSYKIGFRQDDQARELLNQWEAAMLPGLLASCGKDTMLRVAVMKVLHPWDKARVMPVPCGFALTEGRTLRFLRIQDHLRGAGIGSAVLSRLMDGRNPICTTVDLVNPKGEFKEWDERDSRAWTERHRPPQRRL